MTRPGRPPATTVQATIEFRYDPDAMTLWMETATVREGEWAGTAVGVTMNGGPVLLVRRHGQQLGFAGCTATDVATAVLQALGKAWDDAAAEAEHAAVGEGVA